MMARNDIAQSTVEYGIQTMSGNTILTVTEDLAEAQAHAGHDRGRPAHTTVSYSPWIAVEVEVRLLG
jgi:hypothetical protein